MANTNKFGVYMCLLVLTIATFGSMNISAQLEEPSYISKEIKFWDNFEDEVLTDKWDVFANIAPGFEIDGNTVSSETWSSWFLESEWGVLMNSPEVSGIYAYAVSKPQYEILEDYIIQFNFTAIPSVPAPPFEPCGNFKVVYDMNVLLTIEGCDSFNQVAHLYAYDGSTGIFLEDLEFGKDYFIEIRSHITAIPPTYDVYLMETFKGTFDFYSGPFPIGSLTLGDDGFGSDDYGEASWDNIVVAEMHEILWEDDFEDGKIRDWTAVVDPSSNSFTISNDNSVPGDRYDLYMEELEPSGGVAYGFTPYYDVPNGVDYYLVRFDFRFESVTNRFTVFADGNVRMVLDPDRKLKAYLDESTSQEIPGTLTPSQWYSIRCKIYPTPPDPIGYDVFIDDDPKGFFNFVQDPRFRKAPSSLFLGDHVDVGIAAGEAYWDNMKVRLNHPPTLTDAQVDPNPGYYCITEFIYTVKYWDIDNDPPETDYPKVTIYHDSTLIGTFVMQEVNPGATDYTIGKDYYFITRLMDVSPPSYTFYFEAKDIWGEYVRDPAAPPDHPGPEVNYYTSEPWPMFHHDAAHLGYTTSIAPDSAYICWNYYPFWGSGWPPNPSGVMSAAVKDGRAFVVTKDNVLYAVDSYTGNYLWEYRISDLSWYNSLQPSPTVAYGRVYVGEYYGRSLSMGASMRYDPHRVHARFVDGSPSWIEDALPTITSALTVADGKVFVPTSRGLTALNAYNGDWLWEYGEDVHGPLSSPAFYNDIVYVADEQGYIHAVYASGPSQGQRAGLYERVCDTYASVTVADKIYIGEEGPCPGQPSTGYRLNAIELGPPLQLAWTYQTNGPIKSTAAVAYGMVYVLNDMGWLYAINTIGPRPGSLAWDEYVGPGKSSPAVADGKVCVGDGHNERLVCLNAYNGDLIWEYPSLPVGASSPTIADGMVFVPVPNSDLYAFG